MNQHSILSPISLELQPVCLLTEEMQEHCLIGSLEGNEAKIMSSNSLSALSDGSSPDLTEENCYDGSEFLQTENVGVVTPPRNDIAPVKIESRPNLSLSQLMDDTTDKDGRPTDHDVLCGQSRVCASHPGNRRFQAVLDMYAPRYDAATSKQEKMSLTKEIVGVIAASTGRFLKYKDGVWVEISNVTARDKVSHALRTKVQSWKRQKQEKKSDKSPSKKTTAATHRRRSRCRRSSSSSIVTTASDIYTSSFDGNSPHSSSIMEDLLRTQREIFANLTQIDKANNEKQIHPLKKQQSQISVN